MRTGFKRYTHFSAFVLPLFLLLFLAPVSEGATFYVNAGAGGANNGTSWTNAFTSLQAALAASVDGDELWVAAGTYKPTAGADREVSFVLKKLVALYGGFIGTENSRDQRNWTVNLTILSGNIGNLATDADNSYHVVNGSATAVFDGFTISDGNANGPTNEQKCGGGMFVKDASPAVKNCIFTKNNAADIGGGMYNNNNAPAVSHCTFTQNSALHGGGMVNINKSNPAITGCTFSKNSADYGGGMYNAYSSSPTIANTTFSDNIANDYGGGMRNSEKSAPFLTNCIFSGNSATSGGGGMFNDSGSTPAVNNTIFSANTSGFGGGMYNANGGNPIITNSTFSGNSAKFSGGALRNDSSNPAVMNCTFSGNSAVDQGGGLCNAASSTSVLMNCTFSGNSAKSGGGMFSDKSAPVVTNTIFWGAGATTGQVVNQNGATPVITYSVTDQPGTGNIAGDPKLGPLADNGGPTMTHALLDGSSALDAGTATGAPVADQLGTARPQGSGIDIGAFEKTVAAGGGSGGGCDLGCTPSLFLLLLPLLVLVRR